ncbi:Wzz/FepE/Etk N-terminal domain-containing protein [Aerococcus urinaeequi]|uniref:YveK family protein n=1 Tax=Aerococcus urinaeequi TaxID=51665 RepID=UPI00227EA3AE|nr:Wzz/FepE/Etk N-terminal domain-containing protein [Aerococcus urinaeequi]MCY7731085.1 Wzz/FepE/Etk N-terminal domain-containing protein [Aerococcus urinaeequi]
MEKEYSLYDLWQLFKKYFVRILNMGIIGATLAAIVVMFFVEPQYSSQAQLIVNQRNSQDTSIQYNEVQTNVTLVSTYRDIILGDGVLNEVNNSLDGKFTIPQLRNALSVEQSTDSQAFNISATMDTPGDAQNIVNSAITEFEKTLISIYGDDVSNLYVVSSASFNPKPVSPNVILYTVIGGFVGAMIMVAIALVIELLDSRVKSSDDLIDLQMVKLGEISELSENQKEHCRVQSTVSTKSRGRRV